MFLSTGLKFTSGHVSYTLMFVYLQKDNSFVVIKEVKQRGKKKE